MLKPYQKCERKKPLVSSLISFFKKRSFFFFRNNSARKAALLLLPILITNIILSSVLPLNAQPTLAHNKGGQCKMTLTKVDSQDPVMPGQAFFYTLVLKNIGTANCTGGGVKIKEHYSPDTTVVSSQPVATQGNDLWNFGTVTPGTTHTVTVNVTASNTLHDGDTITNQACFWTREYNTWVCTEETTKVSLPPTPPPPPPQNCTNTTTHGSENDESDSEETDDDSDFIQTHQDDSDQDHESAESDHDDDSSDQTDPTSCPVTPTPVCGNAIIETGEDCDLGGQNNSVCAPAYGSTCSYCSASCQTITLNGPQCGDDIKNGAEECDDNAGVGANEQCSNTCTIEKLPFCGDSIKNAAEQCDGTDGVGVNQTCSNACTLINPPSCGDTIKNGGEECDGTDGVGTNQACTAQCTILNLPNCGNGTLDTGEQCDLGAQNGAVCSAAYGLTCGYCSNACQNITLTGPACGDGVKNGSEECDGTDGVGDGQTCSALCVLVTTPPPTVGPTCGDNIKNGTEACDGTDGVGTNQTCTAQCTLQNLPICGDSIIDSGEQCDDGNAISGDGCSNTCQTETPPVTPACTENCGGGGGGGGGSGGGIQLKAPRLLLKKTASVFNTCSGNTFDYTINITNIGNDIGKNLIIADTLPTGFTLNNSSTTAFNLSLGDINSYETKTYTYTVNVPSSTAAGDYVNAATATIDNGSAPNNSGSAQASVRVLGVCETPSPTETPHGVVLGAEFTELPDTGSGLTMIIYFIANTLALILGIFLYRKTRLYGYIR